MVIFEKKSVDKSKYFKNLQNQQFQTLITRAPL
jgi:hypothetical protein